MPVCYTWIDWLQSSALVHLGISDTLALQGPSLAPQAPPHSRLPSSAASAAPFTPSRLPAEPNASADTDQSDPSARASAPPQQHGASATHRSPAQHGRQLAPSRGSTSSHGPNANGAGGSSGEQSHQPEHERQSYQPGRGRQHGPSSGTRAADSPQAEPGSSHPPEAAPAGKEAGSQPQGLELGQAGQAAQSVRQLQASAEQVLMRLLHYDAARRMELFRQGLWTCNICFEQLPGGLGLLGGASSSGALAAVAWMTA